MRSLIIANASSRHLLFALMAMHPGKPPWTCAAQWRVSSLKVLPLLRLYCGFESAIEIFDFNRPGSEGVRMRTTPSRKSRDGQKGNRLTFLKTRNGHI